MIFQVLFANKELYLTFIAFSYSLESSQLMASLKVSGFKIAMRAYFGSWSYRSGLLPSRVDLRNSSVQMFTILEAALEISFRAFWTLSFPRAWRSGGL